MADRWFDHQTAADSVRLQAVIEHRIVVWMAKHMPGAPDVAADLAAAIVAPAPADGVAGVGEQPEVDHAQWQAFLTRILSPLHPPAAVHHRYPRQVGGYE